MSTASAGDWAIEAESADMIEVEYTGDVDFSDPKSGSTWSSTPMVASFDLLLTLAEAMPSRAQRLFWLMDAYPVS